MTLPDVSSIKVAFFLIDTGYVYGRTLLRNYLGDGTLWTALPIRKATIGACASLSSMISAISDSWKEHCKISGVQSKVAFYRSVCVIRSQNDQNYSGIASIYSFHRSHILHHWKNASPPILLEGFWWRESILFVHKSISVKRVIMAESCCHNKIMQKQPCAKSSLEIPQRSLEGKCKKKKRRNRTKRWRTKAGIPASLHPSIISWVPS